MNRKRIQGASLLFLIRVFVAIFSKCIALSKNFFRLLPKRQTAPFKIEHLEASYIEKKIAILIPTYNGWEWLQKCIESIKSTEDDAYCDIWVSDDASSDETVEKLKEFFPNVNIINNSKNLGFLKSCNNAFRQLRGYEWIFLLNNDTEVQNGFLLESLKLASKIPNAALIGSKLVYPDGSLQEAGAFIWQSGNGWNFGRNSEPSRREFNLDRQVDYCSGAAVLLRTKSIFEVALFSEDYLPAYYEDVDLAFKLRKAGYETWYAHKSVVMHHEGKSHGTDTASGVKNYQIANGIKFSKKWALELESHEIERPDNVLDAAYRLSPNLRPNGQYVYLDGSAVRIPEFLNKNCRRLISFYRENETTTARAILFPQSSFLRTQRGSYRVGEIELETAQEGLSKKSILFVENAIPKPDTNAGDLSTFMYLKLLSEMGHNIVFMPVLPFVRDRYFDAVASLGVRVIRPRSGFGAWLKANSSFLKKIWIARPDFARGIIKAINANTDVEIFYYTQDLHFLRTYRQSVKTKSLLRLFVALSIWKKEQWIFNNVSKVLSVSFIETELIGRCFRHSKPETLQPFFYSKDQISYRRLSDFDGKNSLIFLGSYSHSPNVDAVKFLVSEIMPIVWQTKEDVSLTIAGFGPPPEILALASKRVKIVGHVESLETLFESARAMVAPLRYGAGVKGKVIESMRLGLPVVGTQIAFESIPVEDGLSALIADKPQSLAKQILRISESDELAAELSKNASLVIEQNYSLKLARAELERLFGDEGY